MDLAKLAETLAQAGGWGVASLGFWLFFSERKENRKLTQDILTSAIKGTEAAVTMSGALTTLKEVIVNLSKERA